ncbi:trigger factor [Corynebacterium epidermidicanis]|uniref:Trigger factor n=1 Tax=Corynebacterium epidermidicanis TaxID=1050174 RepID=A0A0G3GW99_9CORY|nr:trigger factor [Corynebacterium epidermidicanis]AKK03798.1 trigger factor [Corynebacterium epidermidicanis]
MKSSVEQLNDTRVKITVEVPFDELKPEFDQAYQALSQQVSIPGFRKGKAPRQLLEARIGRGPVLEQVVNDMLPSRYSQAVDEHELKVIGQPVIDITKLEDGELVEFTADVDVRPEITLPDFSEFKVEVEPLQVGDDAVDHELDHLRERFGTLKDHNHKLKKGEFVTLNITATDADGETIEDLGTEGLNHQIGGSELIDGLDDALLGAKNGETVEFETTLPSGDKGNIKAEITATKLRELPEADDEFAQMASEFDTIEELRESLAKQVEENAKAQQASAIRDAVLKEALDKSEFALPQSIVEEQVQGQLQQLLGQFGGDEKIFESLLQAQGTSREEFDKDSRENAEQAVRTQLFLDVLAEEENPEVSQQELSDHILFTAQSYGMDPNQFVSQLSQSGQIANLWADVRRGKALASAICKVTVTDTDGNNIDASEYFGIEEEATETEAE